MSVTGRAERYRLPIRALHWIVALAIPCQFYLGWASERATEWERLLRLHYQLGVMLAALMFLRLVCRLICVDPPAAVGEWKWQRRLAHSTHWCMYVLLLLLPASGYVIWVWMEAPMSALGLFEVPRLFVPPAENETGRAIAWYVHHWSGWLLAGLATVHISAALWHQFVRGDGLIVRRML